MNVACVLLIKVTIKALREIDDIEVTTNRVLTFPPSEGMTLVFVNDAEEEYEVTLGSPRYEFAESAFVEYQEDSNWLENMRDGQTREESIKRILSHYKSFGFKVRAINPQVISAK